jgi:hypothetical protein
MAAPPGTDVIDTSNRQMGYEFVLPVVTGSIAFFLGTKSSQYVTHKWTVYVRHPNNEDLSHIVQKVRRRRQAQRRRRRRRPGAPARPRLLPPARLHDSRAPLLGGSSAPRSAGSRPAAGAPFCCRRRPSTPGTPPRPQVTFTLHSSFTNPIRVVEQQPFELTESGWGEFEVRGAAAHAADGG